MNRFAALVVLVIFASTAQAQDVPTPAAFAEQAGWSHQFAVDAATVGLEKFGSKEVRSASLRLMNDYIVPYGELKAKAVQAGLPAPWLLNDVYGARLQALRAQKGTGFDQMFVRELLIETDKQIALFSIYAEKGEQAELKAYAAKMLPMLKQHQELLQSLEKR